MFPVNTLTWLISYNLMYVWFFILIILWYHFASREDECGIEMQVLGAEMPSRTEQPANENSGANSMLSIDCQDVTSTIGTIFF